jgi:hypothetical protein
MSEAKHSPLPWTAGNGKPSSDVRLLWSKTTCITCIYSDGTSVETQVANAAFIVRAVNSHDHLIATLKLFSENPKARKFLPKGYFDAARAAIAKATGEKS